MRWLKKTENIFKENSFTIYIYIFVKSTDTREIHQQTFINLKINGFSIACTALYSVKYKGQRSDYIAIYAE